MGSWRTHATWAALTTDFEDGEGGGVCARRREQRGTREGASLSFILSHLMSSSFYSHVK